MLNFGIKYEGRKRVGVWVERRRTEGSKGRGVKGQPWGHHICEPSAQQWQSNNTRCGEPEAATEVRA